MAFLPVPLDKLGKKLGQLTEAERFSSSTALNTIAFSARRKVIKNMERRFEIKSVWVSKGVLVNPSSRKQKVIQAEVFHRYWGIAQQEEGGLRKQTRGEPWIIPTKKGKKWLDDAGFRRKPKLKRLLKTEVNSRKPFFAVQGPRTVATKKGLKRRALTPEELPNKKVTLIWTRTSDNSLPLDLLFVAYDAATRIPEKPWFKDIVQREYDNNFFDVFQKQLKQNLKKILTSP